MNKLENVPLNEKIKLTTGHDLWTCYGSETLGLRKLLLADGPHGVRVYKNMVQDVNEILDDHHLLKSTLFPSAVGLASTFNESLIYTTGQTIGKECNHFGVDVLLAPGLNLKRSPLGGRNFEYYSEDPYLTGRIGINFVKGVQSQGVGATIKHFALNEQETYRRFIDTYGDKRTIHELYLKPFKMVIDEAKPYCIMAAYNRVLGDYACESKWLLKDILRDRYQYDGVVMSDWNAVQDKVKSIKNGMNLEMPGPGEFHHMLEEAIQNNTLTEAELDQSLLPMLELHKKISTNQNRFKEVDFDAHFEIAKNVAQESIVLLKNDGILPLNHTKIGVVGAFAEAPRTNGGGSASLRPYKVDTPLDALKKEYTVSYAKGYDDTQTTKTLLKEVSNIGQANDVVLFFTGTTESMEKEGFDKTDMNLPNGHIKVFDELRKTKTKIITILSNGSALDVSPIIQSNAIIESWFLGSACGSPIADIISGKVNPSGRLSETFPLSLKNTPHYKSFPSHLEHVNIHEDYLKIGYRYYDSHDYEVRYPFGYGLSYSTFSYQNFDVKVEHDEIIITGDVHNISDISGSEVVQVYFGLQHSLYPRPEKQLIRFQKLHIQSNSTSKVEFHIPTKELSFFDELQDDFKLESGSYQFYIGRNVRDIEFKEEVEIKSSNEPFITLTVHHPINFFKQYRTSVMEEIIDRYRDFPWHEAEEPLQRVMNRLIKEFDIEEDEVKRLYKALLNT